MTITITTDHPQSSYGIPVCLLDGDPVDHGDGIRACMRELGWDRAAASRATGKSMAAIDRYTAGRQVVPAEVWLVLRDALANRLCDKDTDDPRQI